MYSPFKKSFWGAAHFHRTIWLLFFVEIGAAPKKKQNMCVHNDNDMQPRVRVIVKLNINPSARNLSLLILSTRIRCNQNISPLRLFYTQDCPFHLKRWEKSWRFLLNLIYFLGIHSRMTLFFYEIVFRKNGSDVSIFLESIVITNKFLRRCWSCIFEESWSIWHCNRNNGRNTTSQVPRKKAPFLPLFIQPCSPTDFWVGWFLVELGNLTHARLDLLPSCTSKPIGGLKPGWTRGLQYIKHILYSKWSRGTNRILRNQSRWIHHS